MQHTRRLLIFALILLPCSTAACSAHLNPKTPTQTVQLVVLTETQTPYPSQTRQIIPSQTSTLQRAKNTATATLERAVQICSPLAGYTLEELPDTISNPYHPPGPGSDDPHQGVDLADRLSGSQAAVPGMVVQNTLTGRIAGIIQDRFPYGNAVLVETPFEQVTESWLAGITVPTPPAQPFIHAALTCPAVPVPDTSSGGQSLYHFYAHLQTLAEFQDGQELECGEPIGTVGQSGNALNPHLHLEVRVGPSGWRFESMAHYENRANPAEMGTYCLWRVSGIFGLIDPLAFLTQRP